MNIIINSDQTLGGFLAWKGEWVSDGEKSYILAPAWFCLQNGVLTILPAEEVPEGVLEDLKLDKVI
jgi:hypothetical protein